MAEIPDDVVEAAYEAARPLFHYAKKGQPDAIAFDQSLQGKMLREAIPRIITASLPHWLEEAAKVAEKHLDQPLADAIRSLGEQE